MDWSRPVQSSPAVAPWHQHSKTYQVRRLVLLVVMASNLIAMASTLVAMASNLVASCY